MRSSDTKYPFFQGVGETSPTSNFAQVLPGHCLPISGLSSFLPIFACKFTIKKAGQRLLFLFRRFNFRKVSYFMSQPKATTDTMFITIIKIIRAFVNKQRRFTVNFTRCRQKIPSNYRCRILYSPSKISSVGSTIFEGKSVF